ncbi:MAG TPA: head GIN domain-containing protein [Flavisolibacter sp.]|jgi:hypothetical protein|nr:head GIN domain-containing protein [Flavisolibacter sp.]
MKGFLLLLLAATLLTSCRFLGGERVRGNGNIITAERNLGTFNSIDAGGAVEVRVRQDATHTVRIQTDENLLEYLEVFKDGNTLVIQPKKGYNLQPTGEVVVHVSAPEFRTIEVSGASRVIGENRINGNTMELGASGASEIQMELALSELKADLSGSSALQLRGNAAKFDAEASGSSNINCINLVTDETSLDISGATEAAITANKQLNIEASGASNVEYRGNPSISQNSSGASSVKKL